MKILVVCQYYYPEPFRIPDICEELVKRGNEVTVVTGIPNYPMGEIYEGYQNGEKRDEVLNGVNVHRCYTVPRKTGALHRFLNYYSYAISSTHYVKKLKDEYDVVFVNQLSPVMMANAGITYAKKWKKKLILYCLDIWPESLVAGGISRGSIIYRFFRKASAKVYKAADKILVTSRSFSDYFLSEFGIENTEYLPQYAEALFNPEECKKEPDGFIDLMFAGNVGTAQSVDTIIKAAAKCKDIERLRWHIVGDGIELENCKKLADDLGAPVTFHGRRPVEEMPKYYSMADAMLVTMEKDPLLSLTLPGKIQSYMAAGKPMIGAIDGETKKVIAESKCGFCRGAEDADGLAEIVRQYCGTDKKEMGHTAVEYCDTHFSQDRFFNKLCEELENIRR